MAAGRCTITKDQVVYNVTEPTILDAADVLPELPALLQGSLRAFGLKKFMKVRIETSAKVEEPVELVTAHES
ncbi:hypothetical protein KDK_52440 [Dictyobacter kobayashii]|uniref:Uncharacterized protein n=2 Tax=Dictyobacter kobayashii TaxID=2014872 RepID=A0A402AQS1_9CHLR|nr:hypothetical protein KDK_52440 [Dictyobacter kobayashii]